MKIAVIGGGTAGYMAATQLTKYMPAADLYHIYDSRIPSIGVGEGTTSPFPKWIHKFTDLSFEDLQKECYITPKEGIRFENWGTKHKTYLHYFSFKEGPAYHISAKQLVKVLQRYVTATHLDQKVSKLESNGTKVDIIFEDASSLEVDFAFDARGFPSSSDNTYINLDCIPTNAALLRRGEVNDFQTATRAVARPHGWIFVIPLVTHTSYGYIHNHTISSREDVEADFDQFLREERVKTIGTYKLLHFPSFTHRTFFDGALFKIGNAASFMEPLEATAIGIIFIELQIASYWLFQNLLGLSKDGVSNDAIKGVNDHLFDTIRKAALFVSWHYAKGSSYDTKFWRFAIAAFEQAIKDPLYKDIVKEFEQFLEVGSQFPKDFAFKEPSSELDNMASPSLLMSKTFGGFLDISFTKVGYGIDYFG